MGSIAYDILNYVFSTAVWGEEGAPWVDALALYIVKLLPQAVSSVCRGLLLSKMNAAHFKMWPKPIMGSSYFIQCVFHLSVVFLPRMAGKSKVW